VARDGAPVALIDWEFAGPVDPLVELAQASWLNAKLHDDIVAEREGLPPLAARARQLRAIVDGYGLPADQRHGFFDRIVEYVVSDTANEADEADVTPDMMSHPCTLWAMAWRARAAAWLLRNRRTLENALT
jgi:thiamine kinase-like enzyme